MAITTSGTSITFNDSTTQTTAYQAPNLQTFNSSGTWTKPTGYQMAYIQVWAGGGGGGRVGAGGGAGPGGGGGYNEMVCPLSYLNASVSITVGAGGTGSTTPAVGGDGGTSSVPLNTTYMGVSTVQAIGGKGGTASGNGDGGAPPGAPGTARPPVISFTPIGGVGFYSVLSQWAGGPGGGGLGCGESTGGNAIFGGGGGARTGSTAGTSVYGGAGGLGASGAGTQPAGGGGASTLANQSGGNGGAGRVIITAF